MKRLLAVSLALVAAGLVWSNAARRAVAAPLDAADVAAHAKWLAHIDLDAMRDSKIGEHVRSQALKNEQVEKGLEKMRDDLGLDFQKDVHGATVYGTDFTPRSGVLVLYATLDKEKILGALKSKPDFTESKADDGQDLYSWTEKMGGGKEHTVWAAFAKPGVAVMADSAENIKAALAVVGGKGGLSSSSPLLADAPKGSFIQAAAVDVSEAKIPGNSPLIKQIEALHIAIGEEEGDDFVNVKVEAATADAAKEMKSMVDGLTGMIALGGDHPEAQKLLSHLKVEAEEKNVTAEFKAPAEELIKLGEKMHQQHHASPPKQQSGPNGSENK